MTNKSIPLVESTDAREWASEFVKQVRIDPDLAFDEGAMTSWFASAIEAGRSAGTSKVKNGKEYWNFVRDTAEKVSKWPSWKTGE